LEAMQDEWGARLHYMESSSRDTKNLEKRIMTKVQKYLAPGGAPRTASEVAARAEKTESQGGADDDGAVATTIASLKVLQETVDSQAATIETLQESATITDELKDRMQAMLGGYAKWLNLCMHLWRVEDHRRFHESWLQVEEDTIEGLTKGTENMLEFRVELCERVLLSVLRAARGDTLPPEQANALAGLQTLVHCVDHVSGEPAGLTAVPWDESDVEKLEVHFTTRRPARRQNRRAKEPITRSRRNSLVDDGSPVPSAPATAVGSPAPTDRSPEPRRRGSRTSGRGSVAGVHSPSAERVTFEEAAMASGRSSRTNLPQMQRGVSLIPETDLPRSVNLGSIGALAGLVIGGGNGEEDEEY